MTQAIIYTRVKLNICSYYTRYLCYIILKVIANAYLYVTVNEVFSASAIAPLFRLHFRNKWNVPEWFFFFGMIPYEDETIGLLYRPRFNTREFWN